MIKPSTFKFLELVSVHNEREWFQPNKGLYDEARNNVVEFTSQVLNGLKRIDPLINDEVQAKDCVLRIYRDIRFSKDKTPYKTNFGIGISPGGRNFSGPGYYIHLDPKGSFITGGCWMPESSVLKAIRQEIDYNSSDFHSAIENDLFKRFFVGLDNEGKLKTTPKGYPVDHPDIEYLRLKSFTASSELTREQVAGTQSVDEVLLRLKALYPFIVFLRAALG